MGFVPWPPRPHSQLHFSHLPERFLRVPGGKRGTARVGKKDNCARRCRKGVGSCSWTLSYTALKSPSPLGMMCILASSWVCHPVTQTYSMGRISVTFWLPCSQGRGKKNLAFSHHIYSFSPLRAYWMHPIYQWHICFYWKLPYTCTASQLRAP